MITVFLCIYTDDVIYYMTDVGIGFKQGPVNVVLWRREWRLRLALPWLLTLLEYIYKSRFTVYSV